MVELKLACLFMLLFTLSASLDDFYEDYSDEKLMEDFTLERPKCTLQSLGGQCLCMRSENGKQNPASIRTAVDCVKHTDCCARQRMHCYEGKCVKNVCKGKCGPNTKCIVSIRNKAVCSCKQGFTGNPNDKRKGCKNAPDCVEHNDCSSGELCYAGKCVKDVCTDKCECGANTQCTVSIDNKAVCSCKSGYTGNPADKSKGCKLESKTNNKTFYLGPNNMQWSDAKNYCERKGHKLARILNKEENSQVLAIITDMFSSTLIDGAWLGGHIPHKGQPPYWVNPHALLDYSYFHPGEPNFLKKKENCLEFYKRKGVWMWNDNNCAYKKPFLCEKNNN